MDNRERVILQIAFERNEEKLEDIAVQRKFLEYAMKVIPSLESIKATAPGIKLFETETTEITADIMGGLIFCMDQFLASTVLENVERGWTFLDNDTLLNGLKAMRYYSVVSENCPYITESYERLVRHLKTTIKEVIDKQVTELVTNAVRYIRRHNVVYIIYYNGLTEPTPMIAPDEFVWIFTKKEYADAIIESNKEIELSIKALTLPELEESIHTWYEFGIEQFRLNTATGDHEVEFTSADYLNKEFPEHQNKCLNFLMLRLRQTEDIESMKKFYAVTWSITCIEMRRSLYLVPISCNDDVNEPVEDYTVHLTKCATEKMIKLQMEKQLGVLFYGAENYTFAQPENDKAIQAGISMSLRTAVNNGRSFLALFTDMKSLHKFFGGKVCVGLFTWEDIVSRLTDLVENFDGSITPVEGIVINPGGVNVISLSVEDAKAIDIEKRDLDKDFSESVSDSNMSKTQRERIAKQYGAGSIIRKETGLCTASLVLGIISILFDFTPITGILALVLGIIGRRKALKEERIGTEKALAGIILGIVGCVISLFLIVCIVLTKVTR